MDHQPRAEFNGHSQDDSLTTHMNSSSPLTNISVSHTAEGAGTTDPTGTQNTYIIGSTPGAGGPSNQHRSPTKSAVNNPFQCTLAWGDKTCTYSCKRKSDLTKHIKYSHKTRPDDPASATVAGNSSSYTEPTAKRKKPPTKPRKPSTKLKSATKSKTKGKQQQQQQPRIEEELVVNVGLKSLPNLPFEEPAFNEASPSQAKPGAASDFTHHLSPWDHQPFPNPVQNLNFQVTSNHAAAHQGYRGSIMSSNDAEAQSSYDYIQQQLAADDNYAPFPADNLGQQSVVVNSDAGMLEGHADFPMLRIQDQDNQLVHSYGMNHTVHDHGYIHPRSLEGPCHPGFEEYGYYDAQQQKQQNTFEHSGFIHGHPQHQMQTLPPQQQQQQQENTFEYAGGSNHGHSQNQIQMPALSQQQHCVGNGKQTCACPQCQTNMVPSLQPQHLQQQQQNKKSQQQNSLENGGGGLHGVVDSNNNQQYAFLQEGTQMMHPQQAQQADGEKGQHGSESITDGIIHGFIPEENVFRERCVGAGCDGQYCEECRARFLKWFDSSDSSDFRMDLEEVCAADEVEYYQPL